MLYRTASVTAMFQEQMGSLAPIEVGTRGTVGTLVRKEIEYFRNLEFDHTGRSSLKSSKKNGLDTVHKGSPGGNFWHSFGFLTVTWRRKNKRSSGFLPGVCSKVEVSESGSFSYRNLKDDVYC